MPTEPSPSPCRAHDGAVLGEPAVDRGDGRQRAAVEIGQNATTPAVAAPDWDTLLDRAEALTRQARSRETRRAYRTAWYDFADWCERYQQRALPADPVTECVP